MENHSSLGFHFDASFKLDNKNNEKKEGNSLDV